MMCELCEADPRHDPVTIHRINPTGGPGIWRCTTCLGADIDKVDPIVREITDIIVSDNRLPARVTTLAADDHPLMDRLDLVQQRIDERSGF